MPIFPPTTNAPTDSVNDVLNAARVRMNDEIKSLYPTGGKLLESTQPFTQQAVNSAWRRLQEFLLNLGWSGLNRRAIVQGLPVVASIDPSSQTYINWTNYYDGVNLYPTPVLPHNLIMPLQLWERVSGQNAAFCRMELWIGGLPGCAKQCRNGWWDWRDNTIYMPGSQCIMDLQIDYAAYYPDFVDIGTERWYQQPVSIVRSLDSLSWYLCSEMAEARDDMDAEKFTQKAEKAAKLIMNRDVRLTQRTNIRRRSRSGREHGSDGAYGYC